MAAANWLPSRSPNRGRPHQVLHDPGDGRDGTP